MRKAQSRGNWPFADEGSLSYDLRLTANNSWNFAHFHLCKQTTSSASFSICFKTGRRRDNGPSGDWVFTMESQRFMIGP